MTRIDQIGGKIETRSVANIVQKNQAVKSIDTIDARTQVNSPKKGTRNQSVSPKSQAVAEVVNSPKKGKRNKSVSPKSQSIAEVVNSPKKGTKNQTEAVSVDVVSTKSTRKSTRKSTKNQTEAVSLEAPVKRRRNQAVKAVDENQIVDTVKVNSTKKGKRSNKAANTVTLQSPKKSQNIKRFYYVVGVYNVEKGNLTTEINYERKPNTKYSANETVSAKRGALLASRKAAKKLPEPLPNNFAIKVHSGCDNKNYVISITKSKNTDYNKKEQNEIKNKIKTLKESKDKTNEEKEVEFIKLLKQFKPKFKYYPQFLYDEPSLTKAKKASPTKAKKAKAKKASPTKAKKASPTKTPTKAKKASPTKAKKAKAKTPTRAKTPTKAKKASPNASQNKTPTREVKKSPRLNKE